ncbi:MAG: aspartyl/asparaginyl beta-hydroxylase domain-containing protein [Polyangiaceae bacterium]
MADAVQRAKWLFYQYALDLVLFVPQLLIRRTRDGRRRFFEPSEFPWVAEFEAAYPEILEEYRRISKQALPNYQDIEEVNVQINTDDQWKTYFLHYYGYPLAKAERECPRTVRALKQIPGLQFAMFSILAPRKHIAAHKGPYAGVLRYHLGVDVPDGCVIRVDADERSWANGVSLVFDDSFEHEVWNHSDKPRCVLFVDVERPLPGWLSSINRFLLARSASTRNRQGLRAEPAPVGAVEPSLECR